LTADLQDMEIRGGGPGTDAAAPPAVVLGPIAGIGIDLTCVARMERSLARPRFAERVFGETERAMLARRGWRGQSAAANFAAKEAFGKALGTGLWQEFSPCEAEALRDERGAPYFVFTGRAAALMAARGLTAHLSLTHDGAYAIAIVVLERTAD